MTGFMEARFLGVTRLSRRLLRLKSSLPILVPVLRLMKYVGSLGLKEGSGDDTGDVSGDVSNIPVEDSSAEADPPPGLTS